MKCQIIIDWLTFTLLKEDDPQTVIKEWLKLDSEIFEDQGHGAIGYKGCLYYDDIRVYYNGREGTEKGGHGKEYMGVCVSLSGGGCRTYEKLGGNVLDLAVEVYQADKVNITRLDVACDDKGGALDFEELEKYYNEKRIRTACRKRKFINSENGNYAPARSIYIGSEKSALSFRIYDKAKEHYNAKKEPDMYNSHWIRVEIQMRHEVAEGFMRHVINGMIKGHTFGELVAEVVGGHMQFIEKDDANISRCTVSKWWIDYLETLGGVKITGKEPKKHVFERKLNWFMDYIAPLGSALMRGIGERDFMIMIRERERKQSAAHKNMLRVWIDKGIKYQMLFDDDELFPSPPPPYEPCQLVLTC